MKVDLTNILKSLGWPIGLNAVFLAILALFGISLDVVLTIAASMIGAQALISLLVDVLKWAGVVTDGSAGYWSAIFNLIMLAAIAVLLGLYPSFDFPNVDAQLVDIVKFLALIFGYIIQIAGTKRIHQLTVRGLGVSAFTQSK